MVDARDNVQWSEIVQSFIPIRFSGTTFQFSGYGDSSSWTIARANREGDQVTLRLYQNTRGPVTAEDDALPSQVLVINLSPFPAIVRYESRSINFDTNEIIRTETYEVERFYHDEATPVPLPERVKFRRWELTDNLKNRNTEQSFVTEISYKVVSDIPDSAFDFEFPVGSTIVDQRFCIEYKIGKTAQSVVDSMKPIQ